MNKEMNKEIEGNEPGTCPRCGSNDLVYKIMEIHDNLIIYPYSCLSCHHTGSEYYDIVFDKIIEDSKK